MLNIEACKEHLSGIPLTDEQIINLRDSLYALVENVLDDYISSCDSITPSCKKLSYTAESLQKDKELKGTD